MKNIYFYIDESGVIEENNERFFIIGCYTTDNPADIINKLVSLKTDIENDVYCVPYLDNNGDITFHACDNHFDIRAKYYALLATLDVRAYFLVVDKTSDVFNKMKEELHSDIDIYNRLVEILLYDRIQKNKTNKLVFNFEEYGSNQEKRMTQVIDNIQKSIGVDIAHDISINGKSDILLSVIDYLNYIVFQMLKDKTDKRMIQNFDLIEPKIALLYSMHDKIYYSEKKRINFVVIKGQHE